ncbi:MAG: hypothetical protein ACD_4C00286G0004 [uncultured bacterium (gcode 4)]|uniref:Uncharacterized protein n=1 Tax=uncultured bacterium (gcode 4) TaxID=1234023 RepID=K2F5U5_9BACT|nr:MAG: hypothetical protein ACD_4C00286G0004 [uncultured bacterium (gcode 4)]
MRTISYFISFLALFLFTNIVLSFYSETYHNFLKEIKSGNSKKTEEVRITEKNNTDIKWVEKLDEHIEKIENIPENALSEEKEIDVLEKIPSSLRNILTESLKLEKAENVWFYDLRSPKNIAYSTYKDEEFGIILYVFEKWYWEIEEFLKQNSKYWVNETNNFFWYSFYLNPIKKDDRVRFVIQIQWKSAWFEVIKSNYEKLKTILLN